MQRTIVNISKMRICDLAVGDVVNRDPESMTGWFVVQGIRRLHSGELNVFSESGGSGVTGREFDIVGVQVPTLVEQHDSPPSGDGLSALNVA